MKKELSQATLATIVRFQKDEITASELYKSLAKKQKDLNNKEVLEEMSKAEKSHYETWHQISNVAVKPNLFKVLLFRLISSVLGITFAIKYLEKNETKGIKELLYAQKELPQAKAIIKDEEKHENMLIALLNEERLNYVGSIVLGLNDALVELSGAIAGFTFALADTKTIALAAIITGAAATLSMAASNYLAQKTSGNKSAIKEALYTGIAYLVVVILLVLPYLLLTNSIIALVIMILTVFLIVLFFSYYVAITQSVPFFSRFMEMACICFGVTLIAYLIGALAKRFLGI